MNIDVGEIYHELAIYYLFNLKELPVAWFRVNNTLTCSKSRLSIDILLQSSANTLLPQFISSNWHAKINRLKMAWCSLESQLSSHWTSDSGIGAEPFI